MNEFAYGIAGGALGFIHNDFRGAVNGYKTGTALYRTRRRLNNMPPVSRSRSRGRTSQRQVLRPLLYSTSGSRASSQSVYSLKRARTGSSGSGSYRIFDRTMRPARSVSFGRSASGSNQSSTSRNIKNENGSSVRAPSATKKTSVKKNKRHIKVSPVFAKKVKEVLENKELKGVFSERQFGAFAQQNNGGQSVNSDNLVPNSDGYLFDPNRILDAASVLWNGKTPAVSHALTSSSFSQQNFKVNVVDSYSDFTFKNNTKHTWTFNMYELLARSNREQAVIGSPTAYWAGCIQADRNNGLSLNGNNYYAGFGTYLNTTIGAKPGMTQSWSTVFKSTHNVVVIEPGQTYNHRVQGPKDTMYDFSKFYVRDVFNNLAAGKTMALMVVAYPDITSTNTGSGGGVGRYPHGDFNIGDFICVERYDHYTLSVPEQAGFTFGGSTSPGVVQPLNHRKKVYCHNIYNNGLTPASGNERRIDETNPTITEVVN